MGSETVSFDSSLSKLESDSAPIFDRLRSGSGLRSLSRQDRIVISAFVAAQYLRTDAQRKRYRQLTEDIYEAMKRRGSSDQLLNSLAPIDAEQPKRETILMLPRFTVEVAPLVLNKKWILYRADGRCEFLLSDSPVVMCNNFAKGVMIQGDIGFAVEGVEIFLPISRKLCVCFFVHP